jgi:hypothetical protein
VIVYTKPAIQLRIEVWNSKYHLFCSVQLDERSVCLVVGEKGFTLGRGQFELIFKVFGV